MDVTAEVRIAQPPNAVARVMFDPANDPKWIGGAKSVEALTPGPIAVGSRVRRTGGFMGKKFFWVTEVSTFEPDRRLAMTFLEGPMKGGVTYEIAPDGLGSRVSIRNAATTGFEMPGMAWMVKRSVAADLRRLKALVETVG